jgi:hypothetical protein
MHLCTEDTKAELMQPISQRSACSLPPNIQRVEHVERLER